MSGMKITEQNDAGPAPTCFDDLSVGDFFRWPDCKDLRLKVASKSYFNFETDATYNAIPGDQVIRVQGELNWRDEA